MLYRYSPNPESTITKIVLVCVARPNCMKTASLLRAVNNLNTSASSNHIEPLLVHTAQHYDYEMSQVFLQDVELPKSDVCLGVGSAARAEQTGKVTIESEKVLLKEGTQIKAYDPQAMSNFKNLFLQLEYTASEEVLRCGAILVLTEWEEFKSFEYRGKIVIDGRRISKAREARIYEGVCW